MPNDSKSHQHTRRNIRLKGYDYASSGRYFVTIDCKDKKHRFGRIINQQIYLSDFGNIAHQEWLALANRFDNISLDEFIIMPNHMHGIVWIKHPSNSPDDFPNPEKDPYPRFRYSEKLGIWLKKSTMEGGRPGTSYPIESAKSSSPSLGTIIGAYKSIVTVKCLRICKEKGIHLGKIWHRNYWEHIIRNPADDHRIANYILNNPKRWR